METPTPGERPRKCDERNKIFHSLQPLIRKQEINIFVLYFCKKQLNIRPPCRYKNSLILTSNAEDQI